MRNVPLDQSRSRVAMDERILRAPSAWTPAGSLPLPICVSTAAWKEAPRPPQGGMEGDLRSILGTFSPLSPSPSPPTCKTQKCVKIPLSSSLHLRKRNPPIGRSVGKVGKRGGEPWGSDFDRPPPPPFPRSLYLSVDGCGLWPRGAGVMCPATLSDTQGPRDSR